MKIIFHPILKGSFSSPLKCRIKSLLEIGKSNSKTKLVHKSPWHILLKLVQISSLAKTDQCRITVPFQSRGCQYKNKKMVTSEIFPWALLYIYNLSSHYYYPIQIATDATLSSASSIHAFQKWIQSWSLPFLKRITVPLKTVQYWFFSLLGRITTRIYYVCTYLRVKDTLSYSFQSRAHIDNNFLKMNKIIFLLPPWVRFVIGW